MANLKAIRKRIASVKGTQKITRAMKMIAAAKLRKAQDAIIRTRPYARHIGSLFKSLSEISQGWSHPLMYAHGDIKHVRLFILTSDKGMCGGFNTNIIRLAERTIRELKEQGMEVSLAVGGRKAYDYFNRRPTPIAHFFKDIFRGDTFQSAEHAAELLSQDFLEGRCDEVMVIYNEFKSAISQKVTVERLLPIALLDEGQMLDLHDYVYEPDREKILTELVPQDLAIQVYRCVLESNAAEFGARMTAMEGATKNAKEMIDKLTLLFNRARQAAITKEMLEIVGGAEALNK